MPEDARQPQIAVSPTPHFRVGPTQGALGDPDKDFALPGLWNGCFNQPQITRPAEKQGFHFRSGQGRAVFTDGDDV
jgi:hypothetical protein